jgi:glycopeptide antibiotics resistance protein
MLAFLSRFSSHAGLVLAITAVAATGTAAALMRPGPRGGFLAKVLLFDAILLVGLMTLLPEAGGAEAVNLSVGRGFGTPSGLLQFGANVVLFLPAGFLVRPASGKRFLFGLTAVSFALPIVIEFLQYKLELGRIADVNDVLANATGAMLGSGLFVGAMTMKRRRPQAAPTARRGPARTTAES